MVVSKLSMSKFAWHSSLGGHLRRIPCYAYESLIIAQIIQACK